jgi:ribosomal protein S6E (S10)
MKNQEETKAFSALEKLAEYVFKVTGGFDIDGWKLRTPAE